MTIIENIPIILPTNRNAKGEVFYTIQDTLSVSRLIYLKSSQELQMREWAIL
jgi:hypothetical protein